MPTYSWPTSLNDIQDSINIFLRDDLISSINADQIILGGLSAGAHASVMLTLNQERGFEIQKLILIAGPYDFTFRQNKYSED